ncbi:DUF2934 domain-containing protein [Uliginosibacterium gangwonense]|uniref:DUF2934 domain-containing protein n=1 Tax=Uliginosibacterium gangwonense TaxID=392736 RepID=UPI00037F2651|nr:DUF2934 domain-containing protein [Uliginosibacterium gangwonense]
MKAKSATVAKSKAHSSAKPEGGVGTTQAESLPSPCQLEQLIAEEAYYLAEQRGFAPDNDLADWLQAEANVKGRLGLIH